MNGRIFFHGAAVLVVATAVVAAAQTPSTPKKPVAPPPTAQSSDRDASSGMASGRRQHEPVLKASDKSLGSAHATESVTAPEPAANTNGGQMQNASSNPLYHGKETAGTNPLYEPKQKEAAPKPSTSHETVEYKDPEDMTTRYRPGNNKTSKVKPASSTPTTTPSH